MQKSPRELWEEIREFEACLLVTRSGEQLRSRPMRPFFEGGKEEILFLTSVETEKLREIKACAEANVVFASMRDGLWISLAGKIRLSNRAGWIESCWTEEFESWIGEKRGAVALSFHPEAAEYWDCSEKRLAASWDMLERLASCGRPDPGEYRKLAL